MQGESETEKCNNNNKTMGGQFRQQLQGRERQEKEKVLCQKRDAEYY